MKTKTIHAALVPHQGNPFHSSCPPPNANAEEMPYSAKIRSVLTLTLMSNAIS